MKFDQLTRKLIQIDKNPNVMIQQSSIIPEDVKSFMKTWYTFYNSPQDGVQYSYVWSLVYGWQLQQLNKPLITTPIQRSPSTFTSEVHKKNENVQDVFVNEQQNIVRYISKNEILIKFENKFIWTNPSIHLKNIPKSNQSFIFVITTSNIQNLINFVSIISHFSNIRLITTEHIYRKLKKLIVFLNAGEDLISEPPTYLLKSQQYFEYANIIWLIRQNCWYQSSCDLTLTFNHTKETYLVECQKLTETKLVYYGWKKNLITEENYQRYIRQWDKTVIKPNLEGKNSFVIAAVQKKQKKDKNYWYLQFIKKQLINKLTSVQQDQLFACCQLVQLIPNQIIAKKNYLFDYMYLLLQGEFELRQCSDESLNTKANHSNFYGLKQLTSRENTYNFTLLSIQKGSIFRIQKSNVLFHLYDLLI